MKAMEIPGYTIVRELGKGGMATVYLAIQDRLDRQVALKVMNPELAVDSTFTERFIKEGRIIDQLRHPFIIPLFEFNFYEHYYYFSMEFLPGGTLSQKIQQGLTPERALLITKQIAEALAYAHRHNVIHRDIKPHNVLFRQDDTPVLSDFGIAKVMDTDATNLTALGSVIGSLRYMSPEQATSKPLDARSDLYSLGAVLYEMLTKKAPYQTSDIFSLIQMLGTGPIPVLPEETVELQPIMNKLLAIDPGHRFESAERLIQAIDQINTNPPWRLSGGDTVQRDLPKKPEPEVPVDKPIRAKLAFAIGGLFLAMVVAVATSIYLAVFHHSPRPDSDIDVGPAQPSRDAARQPPRQAQQQAEQLLAQAHSRQQQGDIDESLNLIEQGLRLVPQQPDLLTLRDQVKAEINHRNRIAGLLQDCAARFPLNRLADDQGEAAVACYDQILRMDSTNSEARVNLEQIVNYFADWTNTALLQGNLDKAEDYLARLSRLVPNHPRLSALSQNVRAKREQATAAEEAQRQAKEAARRQAIEEDLRRKTEPEAKRKPPEPPHPRAAAMEAKRKPATPSTGMDQHRRCGDILSRTTLGEPTSNEDRMFLTKECR